MLTAKNIFILPAVFLFTAMISNGCRETDQSDQKIIILPERGLCAHRGAMTTEDTRVLKENGVRVNYFGTDDPDEIEMLFNYGVDFPLVNDIVSSINIAKKIDIKPVVIRHLKIIIKQVNWKSVELLT